MTPVLKKPTLDTSILANFRPVSVLPFISKVMEKIVFLQLQSFLSTNRIYETFQSGFKSLHSTETALIRVLNDILMITDSGASVILIMLDLSSAFDTVDHGILISRLESYVGLGGVVLNWFKSFLTNRTFSVKIGNFTSSLRNLSCGVPQGSVLAPTLFSLYLLPLGSIFRKHNVAFHCYADDMQIYLPLTSGNENAVSNLSACLNDVKAWLSKNSLFLNSDKSEAIVFCPPEQRRQYLPNLDLLNFTISAKVRNLGVVIDNNLQFDRQIASVVGSSFFHLRSFAKIKSFLSNASLEVAIHAFITSRLDYCNSLYYGISKNQISRLQVVQNAAARFLKGGKKFDHVTPFLRSLHWLPVQYRIDYKILLLVYKSLNNLAPSYLSDLLHPYTSNRELRSGNKSLLRIPRTRLKKRGNRAFEVVGPTLWNNLPIHLKMASTLSEFKTALKTYLFGLAFNV